MSVIIGANDAEKTHQLALLVDEGGRVVTLMDVPLGYSRIRISDILPDELGTTQVLSEHLPRRKPRSFERWKAMRTNFSRTEVIVYREIR